MFDALADLDAWAQWLLAVGAALAMLATFVRYVRPLWRNGKSDARAIREIRRVVAEHEFCVRRLQGKLPGCRDHMDKLNRLVR